MPEGHNTEEPLKAFRRPELSNWLMVNSGSSEFCLMTFFFFFLSFFT